MKQWITELLESVGAGVIMTGRTLRALPTAGRQGGRFLEQCVFMGNATVPLVAILSVFIGAVLALQIGYSLVDFGAKQYVGTIVGLALARELGPVMTAIMVTGRVGSAITAELASMRVYQEVDALRTMNIAPERFLVLPRLVAIMVVMPVLVTVAIVTGWMGGQIVSEWVPWIGINADSYYASLKAVMRADDVLDGLIKAQIFGIGIVLICCHLGLRASGGPREIGAAVTRAVVICIIFVLIADYFITNILM